MHRLFLLSSNKVKGRILEPAYDEKFRVRADPDFMTVGQIPQGDTDDIRAKLDKLEQKVGDLTPMDSQPSAHTR
jgi:hypothetical protein